MSLSLMTTYNPLPVAFSHGQGAWLWDTEGNKYLDAMTGIAVCSLGHNHPKVTEAILDQAPKLLHTSNVFQIPHQQALADQLTRISGMEKVFFCNSGAEANEAALKLIRLYGHSKNIEEPEVIVTDGAFHGRTLATLSASGSRKVQAGFEPLVRGFVRAPYNDIATIETIAKNSKTHGKQGIVAIMVEPIQGEGGIQIPAENYLQELRRICDAHDWLLILDEIQTGVGRTGTFYAYQQHNILPDIVTSAKGLGNGIPIGACLARGSAAALFQPGTHGSTFGGNPFACRIGCTVVTTIENEKLAKNAAIQGEKILKQLKDKLHNQSAVKEIRGKGLLIGVELDRPCREILYIALKKGLLMNVTADKVIRLLPPLTINDEEVNYLTEKLVECIAEFIQ